MLKRVLLPSLVFPLALAACGGEEEPPAGEASEEVIEDITPETPRAEEAENLEEELAGGDPVTPAPGDGCPVIDSRDWTAWINAMPGPDASPTLHVKGEVDLPTPGYEVTLTLGAADRSMTPVQQVNLSATPPDGMVTQVVTPYLVDFSSPAIVDTYKGITVLCSGKVLAEITEIETAQ